MAKKRDNLAQFRKDIEAAKKSFAQLTNEIIKLQKNGKTASEINSRLGSVIKETEQKFKATTGAIRSYQNQFKETTKTSKQATTEIRNLNSQFSSLDNTFKRATKTSDTFGQAFRKQFSGESLGKAAGNLLKYVGAFRIFNTVLNLVKNTTVAAAKANIEYEAELAKLEAVTGSTSDDMKMLSDNILQVAGNTKFTSSEIAKLQTSLGKLGFSTQEIVDSTQAIANVAQALGEDAAPVAEKVGQILNQFNLTASESTMVGDVLVSTINNSALSFESFGTAIQYVGPLAAELGSSFVDLSGAMAILADNGFTASRIGTGLRGILTELGTSGRDLESIIRKLADEEISFAEAVELVGKRSAAQLITLVDNIDALEQAEEKYEQTGAAIIASAKQIDTFKGNTELLNSAWNAFLINLGEFYNRAGLVRSALRLLDSEAADTAEGLSLVAEASPAAIGTGIDVAIQKFEELNDKGVDFNDILLAARQAASESIANEILKTDEKMLDLLEKQILYADGSYGQYKIDKNRKEIEDLRLETMQKVDAAIASEVQQQVESAKIQSERNKIAQEYKGTFEGLVGQSEKLKELAKQQKLSEEERGKFNVQIEKELNQLKEKREKVENGELKNLKLKQKASIELSDEEELRLKVLESQVEEYDTQIGKFRNLLVFTGVQKKDAKESKETFDDQIKALNRQIEQQKEILQNRLDTAKVQREALENQLEAAKTDEERAEIQGRIRDLEERTLFSQQATYNTILGLVDSYKQKLSEAGLSAEETAKATEKIEDAFAKVADLRVDFPELAKVSKRLAKDFKERFGEQLKSGKELTDAQKEFVDNYVSGLISQFENISPDQEKALRELVVSGLIASDENEFAEQLKKTLPDILGELQEVFDEYNKTYLENKKATLEADLDAVKRKFKIEEDILKAQLDNQLITESQFRLKSIELQKSQLAQENSINKKIFEAEKTSDLNVVAAETAEALASSILNNYGKYDVLTASGILAILSTAAVLGAGAAKADAIRRRQFVPVKFEEGGMVYGPSHSEGGIPFSVQGRGGYEMEGGEFIVNKRAAAMHRDVLEKINNSYKPLQSVPSYKFAAGGLVTAQPNESVDYLKAIAEATTSTAIQSQKPVRAFVSDKDLRTNANERRLRDRNDKI